MRDNLASIIVLDLESKKNLKTLITDFMNYDIEIVNSLQDIKEDMLRVTNKVILLDGFLAKPGNLTELKMFKEVFKVEYYFLSNNIVNLECMKFYAKCFKIDHTMLDLEKLSACLLGDEELYNKVSVKQEDLVKGNRELAESLIGDPTIDVVTQEICKNYVASTDMVIDLCNIIEAQRKKIEELETMYLNSVKRNEIYKKGYKKLIEASADINRNNLQYEALLTKNVYDKVILSSYPNRPLVLYFKEYEELIHFNSFIEILYNTILQHLHLTCKVVKLCDDTQSRRLAVTNGYTIIRNNYKESDIVKDDFLLKYGGYKNMFDIILNNRVGVDVLIIIDCKSFNDTVVSGENILFNLCRNENHISLLNLPPDNTIVNNSIDHPIELSWDTYDDIPDDKVDRFIYLSSKPLIKNIIEYIEEGLMI